MPRWITGVGTLFLVTTFLAGCGSDPGFSEEEFRSEDGTVQFVNMMPDSPQVRMFHGLSQDDIAFPFVSPIELRFVDRYDWEIAYVNTAGDRVIIAEDENQQISADTLSTFLFMGTTSQPNIQVFDTPEIPSIDRVEGQADVWFASNSTLYDMVDIYLIDADANLADAVPLVTLTSGTFTQLNTVPSGTSRRLWITVAGTDQVIFDSGAFEVVDQQQELFAVVDDFGTDASNHVDVIRSLAASRSIMQDFSQVPGVRVGNYSTFDSIDAQVGDTAFNSVSEDSLTSYQETAAGTVTVTIEAEGSGGESADVALFRGRFQSIISFDDPTLGGGTSSIIVLDEQRPITDRATFKFINGTNQTVDVYGLRDGQDTDDVPPLVQDAGFAGTNVIELFTDNLRFLVVDANSGETVADLNQNIMAGENYTLILDSESELRIQAD